MKRRNDKCMKFRKHYQQDYLKLEGAKIKAFFDNPNNLITENGISKELSDFLDEILMVKGYSAAYEEGDDAWPIEFSTPQYNSFEKFANDIGSLRFISDMEAKFCLRSIPLLSLNLFKAYPEYAFPYLFPQHFYMLQALCREFDIDLPNVPNGNISRFRYYLDVCRAMYEFRISHDLSPSEMCAFVYGFALRDVRQMLADCDKTPSRIFMVHASPADQEKVLSGELSSERVCVWQGRESMRMGDLVLMYERAPSSSFGSVWKAVSPGFDDPFDLYPGKVFLGEPVKFPHVSFAKLAGDSVWGIKPEVKAHMQGGSGRVCSVKEYEALKALIHKEDPSFDLGKLPTPPTEASFDLTELKVEHDVEVNLLEPLLVNLGFKKGDWVCQYSVRIGRDNSSRPDYVLGLKEFAGGRATADLVFEAKHSIPNKKQREKDQGQVLAYAGILSSRIATLVSKEGIWIYKSEDKFDFDKGEEYTWAELEKPDVIARLACLYRPNIVTE